ncbi:hypothetical protein [Streptomyces fulvorobeus]|uniref:Uncharacterized protein n=1 Tax=Streptomyces fulvorobeus TaxID=284028 RepID=A0A7J0CE34_9ACTN|nr:hypothetical protein [Streptomyces fulvorobeus]NYE44265.1 hypothetical protein [Streptomyces fulvorobeus]GFN00781.1 hypothetical protein Sfulv_55910 [Streptomyces fulvorobeus]
MEATINDVDGAFISVEAGADSLASDGSVRVYAPANELTIPRDEPVALLDFTPAQARALAAVLLQAADEAEGVEPLDEGNARSALENILVSGHIISGASEPFSFGDLDRYRDAVAERARADVAAFIRTNIDFQGRDFPDAESVAVWLEDGQ